MAILDKGKTFGSTETVTSGKLHQLVTSASFKNFSDAAVAYNGTTGTCLQGGGLEITATVAGAGNGGGQLKIADLGVTNARLAADAVNQDKIADDSIRSEHIADNAINSANMITGAIINTGNIVGDAIDGTKIADDAVNTEHIADDAVENAQIAANAVQNAQMADNSVNTNEIVDSAVTFAKTDFISSSTGAMILTGTEPQITFNDTNNPGTSPRINANSTNGNISIIAEQSGSDIFIDADDNVILKNNGSQLFATSATAGKNTGGTSVAGAKVTGALDVTSDIHTTGDVAIKNTSPTIILHDTANTNEQPTVKSYETGTIEITSSKAGSAAILDGKASVQLEVDNTDMFVVSATAGKTEAGADASGGQLTGSLEVTDHLYVENAARLGTSSILQSTPSEGDNSTKIATTAYADRAATPKTAIFTINTAEFTTNPTTIEPNLTETSDPDGLCGLAGGDVINIDSTDGLYAVSVTGTMQRTFADSYRGESR